MSNAEYLIECRIIGQTAKITAIDPKSGLEAVVQGPAYTAQTTLPKLAVKKLEYLIQKKQNGE
jgi:hypothetical protein